MSNTNLQKSFLKEFIAPEFNNSTFNVNANAAQIKSKQKASKYDYYSTEDSDSNDTTLNTTIQEEVDPTDWQKKKMMKYFRKLKRNCFSEYVVKFFTQTIFPYRFNRIKNVNKQKDKNTDEHFTSLTDGMLENFCGALGGIAIGLCIFFLFLFTFTQQPGIAIVVACAFLILTVYGMAHSKHSRSIFCLMMPYMLSGRIRWILFLFTIMYTTMGPSMNFIHNVNVLRNSLACVLGQVAANFRLIKYITKQPFALISQRLQAVINGFNGFLERMREMTKLFKFSLFEARSVVLQKSNWLNSLAESCSDKVALNNQCLGFFNDMFISCKDRIKWKSLTFMCYTLRYLGNSVCIDMTSLVHICNTFSAKLKSKMSPVSGLASEDELQRQAQELNMLIGVNNLSFTQNQDAIPTMSSNLSSMDAVTDMINAQMDNYMIMLDLVKIAIGWITSVWAVISMLQVFAQAYSFRSKWLKRQAFANEYITAQFVHQEEQAYLYERVMTLPLVKKERRKYRTLQSILWSSSEITTAFNSLLKLLIFVAIILLILVADYAIYVVIDSIGPKFSDFNLLAMNKGILSSHMSDILQSAPEEGSKMVFEGKSMLTELVNNVVQLGEPLLNISMAIDASICRPEPNPPDAAINKMILIFLSTTFVSIITEVYLMRTRHSVLAAYYPLAAWTRAAWLRTHIRNNRGLQHKLAHHFRAMEMGAKKLETAKTTWFGRKLHGSRSLTKFFGYLGVIRINCQVCGNEGNPGQKYLFKTQFTRCQSCGGYYCRSCQIDVKAICVICDIPLDVLTVEVDFETLSSDEEFDVICAQYLRRREKLITNDNNNENENK